MKIIPLKQVGKDAAKRLAAFDGEQGFAGRATESTNALAILNTGIATNLATGENTDRGAFTVNIINANATNQRFYIKSGYTNQNGQLADGVFASITGDNLTGSGSPKTIAMFLKYINANPTFIKSMKIDSDSTLQFAQDMFLSYETPFTRSEKTDTIRLKDHKNEFVVQDTTLSVNAGFIAAEASIIEFTIVANSTLSITFYPDATIDIAGILAKGIKAAGGFNRVKKGLAFQN